jgi:hypothetical protein
VYCIIFRFNPKSGSDAATRIQIPLKLAYALTIHKSQGMTLDWVEVDCAGLFAPGQLAVAISRVKSSSGLRVVNFNPQRHIIEAHSDVKDFYETVTIPLDANNNCCSSRLWKDACTEAKKDCPVAVELPADDELEPATDEELISILAELAENIESSDFSGTESESSDSDSDEPVPHLSTSYDTTHTMATSVKPATDTGNPPICTTAEVPFKVEVTTILDSMVFKNPLTPEQEANNADISELKLMPHMQCIIDCCLISLHRIWTKCKIQQGAKHVDLKNFYVAFDKFLVGDFCTVCSKHASLSGKSKSFLLTKLLFKLRQQFIEHKRNDVVQSESKVADAKQISDDGKGKIRYLSGRSVSLVRKQFVKKLESKLKSSRGSAKAIANTQRGLAHINHMKTHVAALRKGPLSHTLHETERRQNVGGGLTHVTDETFKFHMELEVIRQQQHTLHRARKLKGDILFDSRNNILQSDVLRERFSDIFHDYDSANVDVMAELFEMLVDRFIVVANNEFRKKIAAKFGKRKKFRHRAEIYKTKASKAGKNKAATAKTNTPVLEQDDSKKNKGISKRRKTGKGQSTSNVTELSASTTSTNIASDDMISKDNDGITEEEQGNIAVAISPSPYDSSTSKPDDMDVTHTENPTSSVSPEDSQASSSTCTMVVGDDQQIMTEEQIHVVPDEPSYCLCEQVAHGDMVACDNNACTIEWFHFICVGLKKNPKGKWFCPKCRGRKSNIIRSDLN